MTERYSLNDIIQEQIIFEKVREGTDGTLWDKNTIEYGLTRGVIGEAEEALEEMKTLRQLQVLTPDQEELIKQTFDKLVMELVDIQIFLASIFAHAGLNEETIMRLAQLKMSKNREKYHVSHFESRTISEGLQYSREKAARKLEHDRQEARRSNGHPRPGDLRSTEESQERTVFTNGAFLSQG